MVPLPAAAKEDIAPFTAQPSLKELPQRWLLVVLMHIGMFFCYVHRSALSVAAPFMIVELGLDTAVMGVLLSAFFWPYSLLQTPAGWAVDRFGVRRSYAWGYALWSIAATATGFARGMFTLSILRGVVGVGQAVIFPAHGRAIANWFSERERGLATGIANAGSRLGQSAVNGIGPMIIVALGWQMFFVVTGALPLVWLLPWLLFMRRHESAKVISDNSTRPSFLASFALLKHRSVLGMCLGYTCYNYCWILLYTWLPGYLKLERGFTTNEMAFFSSVPYLVAFFVALSTGALSDWFVRRGKHEPLVRKLFMITGMAGASVIVPAGMVTDKMTAVYLLSFAVCSLSISGIAAWALLQSVCERQIVGTVGGLQNFFGNLGGIVAPALSGFIAKATGSFALAMGLTGVLLALGITAYAMMVKQPVRLENTPAA
ncbi:MAG TPA: MFS transporter [Blastocatellia bacterium]|nr:MFS transporter [Blastocatellia bacterium]